MALTNRQLRFVDEYLVDLNATQAAIRAGYSRKAAGQVGDETLKNPKVASAIQEAQAKRSSRVQIDADYVLARLVEIDKMDVLDILEDDMALKPVSEWPQVWRRYLSGFDVSEIAAGGNAIGVLKKVKWPDKVRNLELLGKHVGVGAFRERLEHTGPGGGPVQVVALSKEEYKQARSEMLSSDDC